MHEPVASVGEWLKKVTLGVPTSGLKTASTAVQRLRNRAKASSAPLLDAMEQQTPWDAARCAELGALGLGLGPCAPLQIPRSPSMANPRGTRGLIELGFYGAHRRPISERFRVAEFSTGTMEDFSGWS